MSLSSVKSIIPIFVPHLGCPNNCVFCNQRKISGSLKPATAGDVRHAVKYAINNTERKGERQLAFYGGSFTAIPASMQDTLLSAAYEFVQSGDIDSIRLSTRPDAIDEEILNRLKRYGVRTIELGAQSLDEEVLRLSGRGHSAKSVELASNAIKNAGFELVIQMMTGLPGDTREKSIATAKKIIAIKPDGVRIYPTVVVKDTELYDNWLSGDYTEHTIEEAVDWCSILVPLFEKADITIIRLGLNPTDELSAGTAVAGAYHPALGELVKSEIIRKSIANTLEEIGGVASKKMIINCNPRLVSQISGQRGINKQKLKSQFGLNEIKIVQNPNIPNFSFDLL